MTIHYLALTQAGDRTAAEEVDAWSGCDRYTYSLAGGAQVESRVEAVEEVDHLGEQAYGVQLSADYVDGDGVGHTVDKYVLRVFRGGSVSVVAIAVEDSTGEGLPELAREWAVVADEKVRTVLAE